MGRHAKRHTGTDQGGLCVEIAAHNDMVRSTVRRLSIDSECPFVADETTRRLVVDLVATVAEIELAGFKWRNW